MSDLFTTYEDGLKCLVELLGITHPDLSKALTFQNRLFENIGNTRLYGNTSDRKSERAEIIRELNEFTLPLTGQSFNELCEHTKDTLPSNSESDEEQPPLSELSLDFLTHACKYIKSMQEEVLQAYNVFSLKGGDIWPYQCTKISTAFQKWKKPPLPNDLPLASLEVKLSYVHEQAQICIQLINDFSPYGRQQSDRAIGKRQVICQKLDDLIVECNATIMLINASDGSALLVQKCISQLPNEGE